MSFTIINLIAPVFALLMIGKAVSHYRRHEKTWREIVAIVLIWGAVGYLGGVPGSIDVVASFLGVKSGLSLIFFLGMTILFFIVFQLLMAYELLEMRLTKVVRELALKEARYPEDQQ